MRINFKPKNQEEVFAILLFYWAYWWRAMCLFLGVGSVIIMSALSLPVFSTVHDIFLALLVAFAMLTTITSVTLCIFKKLSSLKFKTFSVKWIIPEPQSIFEKEYFKKVLIYLGVLMLSGIIVFPLLNGLIPPTFLLAFAVFHAFMIIVFPLLSSLIFSTFLLASAVFHAFLFYLFAKNEWLPFVIEAKEEGIQLIEG